MILPSPDGHSSLPSVVRLLPTGLDSDSDSDSGTGTGTSVPVPPPSSSPPDASASDAAPWTLAALGHAARDHALEFPTTTLHSTKRLLGRSAADLAEDLPHLPYAVVEGPHDTARIALPPNIQSKILDQKSKITVTPQEVAALLLRELKRWAEAALGTEVTRAVITVPAYFDDAQRQATRDAGRLAGLNVLRLVNEPTAAALAYGLGLGVGSRESGSGKTGPDTNDQAPAGDPHPQKPTFTERGSPPKTPPPKTLSLNTKTNPAACTADPDTSTPQPLNSSTPAPAPAPPPSQTVAIYDLGGGTFDISILRLQPTDAGGTLDQVLATDGDTHLGGDDLDHQLTQLLIHDILQQLPPPQKPTFTERGSPPPFTPSLTLLPALQQSLRRAAEQAKIALSTHDSTDIEIDLTPLTETLAPNQKSSLQNQKFTQTLTRDEFETLIAPLIDRTLTACGRALRNAQLTPRGPGPRHPRGRQHPRPARAPAGRGVFQNRTVHRPGPRPGRGAGRGGAGRGARRDPPRHAAAGRDPPVAGHRDHGRRGCQAHHRQLHHPRPRHRTLLDLCRRPGQRQDPRPPGRTRTGAGLPIPGDFRPHRHPAHARGPAQDPRDVPGRRQRDPVGPGAGGTLGPPRPRPSRAPTTA